MRGTPVRASTKLGWASGPDSSPPATAAIDAVPTFRPHSRDASSDDALASLFDDSDDAETPVRVAAAPSSLPLAPPPQPLVVTLRPGVHAVVPVRACEDTAGISCRIWRSSLLAAALLSGQLEPRQLALDAARDVDVLELGCGRALAGLAAAELGARSVVLTDCDDRALESLLPLAHVSVFHCLWEQEQSDAEGTGERVRHWSDAYRDEKRFAPLPPEGRYDLVIASDCVYFSCQEAPLVAMLKQRVRRWGGRALLVFQIRGAGEVQLERFDGLLRAAGFEAVHYAGPWDWATMLRDSVHNHSGQEVYEPAFTVNERGDPVVLDVRWRRDAPL